MHIRYTIMCCSTTREVISTVLYSKHWIYLFGLKFILHASLKTLRPDLDFGQDPDQWSDYVVWLSLRPKWNILELKTAYSAILVSQSSAT